MLFLHQARGHLRAKFRVVQHRAGDVLSVLRDLFHDALHTPLQSGACGDVPPRVLVEAADRVGSFVEAVDRGVLRRVAGEGRDEGTDSLEVHGCRESDGGGRERGGDDAQI